MSEATLSRNARVFVCVQSILVQSLLVCLFFAFAGCGAEDYSDPLDPGGQFDNGDILPIDDDDDDDDDNTTVFVDSSPETSDAGVPDEGDDDPLDPDSEVLEPDAGTVQPDPDTGATQPDPDSGSTQNDTINTLDSMVTIAKPVPIGGDKVPGDEFAVALGGIYDEEIRGIATDTMGNSYVVGKFKGQIVPFGGKVLTSAGKDDIFVAKLDSNGEVKWATTAGGSEGDEGFGIDLDSTGNVYVTGYFKETANFGSNFQKTAFGHEDLFVAKLSNAGKFVWVATGGSDEEDRGLGIAVNKNNEAVVTGRFRNGAKFGNQTLASFGKWDVLVAKVSANGAFKWATHAGSGDREFGTAVDFDANGNIFVTGAMRNGSHFGSQLVNSKGDYDIFVAKLSPSGQFLWAKGAGTSNEDRGTGIVVDSSGAAIVTGYFRGQAAFGNTTVYPFGYDDAFVARYLYNGDLDWVLGAGGTHDDKGMAIALTPSGDVVVAGTYRSQATFGSTTLNSTGKDEMFWARVSNTANGGSIVEAESAGSSEGDLALSVSCPSNKDVFVGGHFKGTGKFGGETLTPMDGKDALVWRSKTEEFKMATATLP